MRKGWIVFGALLLVILAFLVVLFVLPNVSNAPTKHGPGSAGSSTNPGPATIADLIEVDAPLPQAAVSSPLSISGRARGSWYFEATAPVELKDSSGTVIAHGTIRAQGSWTTSDFVPFVGTLTFSSPATPTGTLVLKNDNPSGDPKKQKELDIPVVF